MSFLWRWIPEVIKVKDRLGLLNYWLIKMDILMKTNEMCSIYKFILVDVVRLHVGVKLIYHWKWTGININPWIEWMFSWSPHINRWELLLADLAYLEITEKVITCELLSMSMSMPLTPIVYWIAHWNYFVFSYDPRYPASRTWKWSCTRMLHRPTFPALIWAISLSWNMWKGRWNTF